MDVSYVNPFLLSTIETFKKMLNCEIKPGRVSLKDDDVHTYDVSGIIGLSGEAQGSICLSFPKHVALRVISALLGTEIKIVGEEVTDGIGELANIVAGNAKQHLVRYNLSISLPRVVVGKGHKVVSPSATPAIMVPFESNLGSFAIEISLKTPVGKTN